VYSIRSLLALLSRGLDRFQAVSGAPVSDPEHAEVLAEKIFWSKFFRPMTLPTIANKLTAYSALPLEAQRLLKRPDVVWQSNQPQLPPNDAIPAGSYFLKANHGSAMFTEVSFPLKDDARMGLEKACTSWLRRPYGIREGEWWYSTIAPRLIYLERKLNLREDTPSEFKFFTVRGKVAHFHAYLAKHPRVGTTIYNQNLQYLDIKTKRRPNPCFPLPQRITDLYAAAQEMAAGLDFVRVDLYLDRDNEIWFGELTLAPDSGYARYSSRQFEAEICRDWNVMQYLYPSSASF
jgi:hypothetical protein